MAHPIAHTLAFLRFIPARILQVSMLIVCCMAYAGPGADADTNYTVVERPINFPPLPARIQLTEIALV